MRTPVLSVFLLLAIVPAGCGRPPAEGEKVPQQEPAGEAAADEAALEGQTGPATVREEPRYARTGVALLDHIIDAEIMYEELLSVPCWPTRNAPHVQYERIAGLAGKIAASLAEATREHERQEYERGGVEFHTDLELYQLNAERLRGAAEAHEAAEVRRYWWQLNVMRRRCREYKFWPPLQLAESPPPATSRPSAP